jgi:gamma-glutamyltranspeptidase / glutathione hydrolase
MIYIRAALKPSPIFLLVFLLTVNCSNRNIKQTGFITENAMVVTAHPLASKVGEEILRKGGNAIDAAIAVQFALAVVYPDAGNIGGGGFLVYRQKDGRIDALDYREEAPSAAHRNMYLNEKGELIEELSVKGHLAAGVPGTVDGMVKAHQKYGTMAWAELVEPAIQLAENGFPLTKKEASKLNDERRDFIKYNTKRPEFILKRRWREGDTIKIPELAITLERIRDRGKAGFYEGETASLIVEEMQRGRGIITIEDLSKYESVWREPVKAKVGEFNVISMPPPSSGGIALIQLLTISQNYPIEKWGHNNLNSAHLMIEAERRVFADRNQHVADPEFIEVPVNGLLDSAYINHRMADFSLTSATNSNDISPGEPILYESYNTTHYSIVDAEGNAISVTTTLNTSFGSRVFVAGAGFLLNNQMSDFSVLPGAPNVYDLVQGEANSIRPGKRMLSSMTPTILEKDDRLFMVIGSMGGPTIITTVYLVVVNVTRHGFPMQGAINAGRFHHQWKPNWVISELGALGFGTGLRLWLRGHSIAPRPGGIGRAAGILVLPDGKLEAGADPRGDDAAAGF